MNLPQAKSAAAPSRETPAEPILLQINAQGSFYWGKEELALDAVDSRVASLAPTEAIVLRVDKDSKFDNFVQIVDILKQHRHDNFRIETQKSGS